jgi:hypothetical protein
MKLVILSWLAGLLGFGLLVGGVAMMHGPAACIIAGIGLLTWSRLADRAAAAMTAKSKPKGG